jgi:hypothetical protein
MTPTSAMKQTDGKRSRELDIVVIDQLNVDHSYQRQLDQALVERVLRDWDVLATDPVFISKRANGSLWIVNGQHRCAAAKLKGESEMIAFVYTGLSRKQEAQLRLLSNNSRPDTSLERFQGQVVAGNKESIAIRELLAEFDSHINRIHNGKTGVNCVSAIEGRYRESPELLRRTLQLITESHGDVKGIQATTGPLRGVYWFLKVHEGEYRWEGLREKLASHGPEDLLRRARAHKAAMGGPDWVNYYRAIVEAYNHRRPEHTRVEARVKYARLPGGGGT